MNRVFTLNEQKQIFNASFINPDTILWTLWAGKETAYKVLCKEDPSVSSVPNLYEVRLYQDWKSREAAGISSGGYLLDGVVAAHGNNVHIRVFIERDYIHCIGTSNSVETLDSVVYHVDDLTPVQSPAPDYESEFVRTALKKHLSGCCNASPEDIEIRRAKTSRGLGPPFIYINDLLADVDISLSHDGRFTAYAFILNNAGKQVFSALKPVFQVKHS